MDNDDRPTGRVLSRREALTVLGVSGAAMLVGCRPGQEASGGVARGATDSAAGTVAAAGGSVIPACVVRPEQTEGP
ncbi:MAG: intradiol ring-cleavage dioxygenase, partial [Gemmatimonadaceae bacterium]